VLLILIGYLQAEKVQRHQRWHKPQISTNFDDGKKPEDLQAGDQIRVDMKKAVFNLTVVVSGQRMEILTGSFLRANLYPRKTRPNPKNSSCASLTARQLRMARLWYKRAISKSPE
jgi:hypothetical protein